VTTIADAIHTPGADDSKRSADLRSAVIALEERVPMGISSLRLCRKVLGFGAFEPLEEPALRPGQNVLVYCEPSGLRSQSKGNAFVIKLTSRFELVSAKEGTKVWEQELGNAEDEFRGRRRDCFVNYRISLPATVAPGDYRLRLILTDLVSNRSSTAELPVTITR
jgi:hypothetical protein